MANTLAPTRGIGISAVSLLLGAALCVLLNLVVSPTPLKEDMPGTSYRVGVYEFSDHASGFYNPETTPDSTTYIWTNPHATLNFEYGANMGHLVHVVMRLAANRPPGEAPARVTVSLNGKPYPPFAASDAFQVYTFTLDTLQVPNPYMDPAHVQVDVDTTYFSTPQDPRQLGIALDWVQLEPEKSRGEIAIEAAIWAVSALVVWLIASSRLGLSYGIIYLLGLFFTFTMIHITYLPRAISPAVEIGLAGLAWLLSAGCAPKTRPVWGLGLAACMLWLIVAGGRFLGDWQVDDAYISYRYAWNLVHGNGLVFNPGEAVEGYTNFLWTLLAAGAIAAGLHPASIVLAANIASGLCLVGLAYYLGAKLTAEKSGTLELARALPAALPIMVAVLLSVDPTLVTYGARGGGLEAVPFALLVLLSFALLWAAESSILWRSVGGLALALAALTRPEGLLVALLFISARALQDYRAGRPTRRLALFTLLPFLAVVLPYQLWRISFYGYLFPNTFYTKTGTTLSLAARGADYTWQFVESHWLVAALAGFWILDFGFWIAKGPKSKIQNRGALWATKIEEMPVALALLVGVYTLYIIVVGGDWIAGYRFFAPLLAPLALLAVWSATVVAAWTSALRALRYGAAVVLVGAVMAYSWNSLQLLGTQGTIAVRTYSDTLNTEWWGSAGLWLRDHAPPQTLTAAQGAGAIAYYSQRPIIDMLGLTDTHIGHVDIESLGSGKAGHEKKDPAYVLSRRPNYILVVWKDYFTPVDSELRQDYERVVVRTATGSTVPWWRRRSAAR